MVSSCGVQVSLVLSVVTRPRSYNLQCMTQRGPDSSKLKHCIQC